MHINPPFKLADDEQAYGKAFRQELNQALSEDRSFSDVNVFVDLAQRCQTQLTPQELATLSRLLAMALMPEKQSRLHQALPALLRRQ